jgi:hypothetical protein
MNNILSLSKGRKTKEKDQKEKQAVENRLKYGRTKHEKKLADAKNKKINNNLSGHKLDH